MTSRPVGAHHALPCCWQVGWLPAGILETICYQGVKEGTPTQKESAVACLSIIREHGPATVAANPIFLLDTLTSTIGSEVAFEVFDADAGELKTLVGEHRYFYVDDHIGVFWTRLKSPEPRQSKIFERPPLSKKPMLNGIFVIVGDSAVRQ
jgi:hypothetical protein